MSCKCRGKQRVFILYLFLLSVQIAIGLESRRSTVSCLLSSSWWGVWFQKGIINYIRIDTNSVSSKGSCISTDGQSKFLFKDNTTEPCVRCMVITQNHYNILQYRETHCYPDGTFAELCSMISSDQELYPMFRVDADPISCPIKAPLTFSYSRNGRRECRDPLSRADACSHDSKLKFKFQACADVLGSQSSEETLTCLATWREGPVSYLIAKLDHLMVSNDNDRYRCFVYEKIRQSNRLIISQSEDATCNGLRESADGDRVMHMTPDVSVQAGCSFPSWVTKYRRWHQMSSNLTLVFTNSSFLSVKFLEYPRQYQQYVSSSLCLKNISDSQRTFRAITHTTIGCDQVFTCVTFRRRQKHILQITSGEPESQIDETCRNEQNPKKRHTLLLAPVDKSMECSKLNGRSINRLYFQRTTDSSSVVHDKCDSPSELRLNCDGSSWMSVRHSQCRYGHIPNIILECHFVWKSNGSTYLITSSHDREEKYCFVFDEAKRDLFIRKGHSCKTFTTDNISEKYTISQIEWCDELNLGISRNWSASFVLFNLTLSFITTLCLLRS